MPAIAVENSKTVENLLAAFEGESNAQAKYTAFAKKADADGSAEPPASSGSARAPSRSTPPIMPASSSNWAARPSA